MRLISTLFLLPLLLLLPLAACRQAPAASEAKDEFQFPTGDAAAGRLVFERTRCFTCHQVAGEAFPAPALDPPAIRLTSTEAAQSPNRLAQSIVSPSHEISGTASGVAEGGERSKMGDFNRSLSVQDVADLVAYLKSVRGQ